MTSPSRDGSPIGTSEVVAGFLASVALVAGAIAVVYRPSRVGLFGIALALVAAAMAGRNSRLAAIAVYATAACWVAGMIVAIATKNPIW